MFCLCRLLEEEMIKWPLLQSLKLEMICVSLEFNSSFFNLIVSNIRFSVIQYTGALLRRTPQEGRHLSKMYGGHLYKDGHQFLAGSGQISLVCHSVTKLSIRQTARGGPGSV